MSLRSAQISSSPAWHGVQTAHTADTGPSASSSVSRNEAHDFLSGAVRSGWLSKHTATHPHTHIIIHRNTCTYWKKACLFKGNARRLWEFQASSLDWPLTCVSGARLWLVTPDMLTLLRWMYFRKTSAFRRARVQACMQTDKQLSDRYRVIYCRSTVMVCYLVLHRTCSIHI